MVPCLAMLGLASPSQAESLGPITFEPPYTLGSIHGQDGWVSPESCADYDVEVAAQSRYGSFGTQSLRISNAVTSGCFDATVSKPLANEAGETAAANGGQSGGTRQTHFESEWDFASAVGTTRQPGLAVVASPDRGDGSRMSFVRMADNGGAGLVIDFFDVEGTANPANFVETPVAYVTRGVPHTIKLTMDFVDGPSNDVVKVYVDGTLRHTGTSWENYYRYAIPAPNDPRTVDSMMFRVGGDPVTGTAGNGFLIDNLTLSSSTPTTGPACTIDRRTATQGQTIQGTSGADVICGSNFADDISGGGGDDVIYGYGGNDLIKGQAGNDTMDGGDGNDTLRGNAGNDTLIGGSGTNKGTGGPGTDSCTEIVTASCAR